VEIPVDKRVPFHLATATGSFTAMSRGFGTNEASLCFSASTATDFHY